MDDVFRFIALDGSSTYETDLQTARASLLFPGNGLILGPNLACGTFGGSFPEEFAPVLDACTRYDYPLSVTADASNATQATDGGLSLGSPTDPVSANAVSAKAHAAADGATTYAAMDDLRVLGLPALGTIPLPLDQLELDPSILTIDSAASKTAQHIEAGALVVDAESVLSGVRLVGGLIHIGSIRSSSHITDDAAGTRTADASLEVSGVTVAGVPAQITEDGLVVGSPSGGSGPLQQQVQTVLNQVLEALHVKITLLDAQQTLDDGGGRAVASSGGLLIEVATEAQGLPTVPGPLGDLDPNGTYVGSIQLGSTAAAGGATNFAVEEPVVPDGPAYVGGLPIDAGGSSFDSGAGDVAPPPAEVASPPASQSSPPQLVRSVTDLFGGRMGLLYLAFTFAVLGLCLVPRLALPARLPGPRS